MSRACAAVIFDLDGTLTRPNLDFDEIRAKIGLPPGPILESLSMLDRDARRRAEHILAECEAAAAASSELQPHARETMQWLRARRMQIALMTRNSAVSVNTFLARHAFEFDAVWTREDGPFKPSPEPVLQLCRRLYVSPDQTFVVGDYLFDLQSGRRAGATAVLLNNEAETPSWADEAHHVIRSLSELPEILSNSAPLDARAWS